MSFVSKDVEQVVNGTWRPPIPGHLSPKCCDHQFRCEIKLVEQELVLMQHLDAEAFDGGVREVLQVLGDQQFGAARHGCRENMSIFGVLSIDVTRCW